MPQATTSRRIVAIAALAVALGGCSSDLGLSSIQLNPFSGGVDRSQDYNYFYRRDGRTTGAVTAVDLVGPDGRCAFDPAPAPTASYPAPPPAGAPQAAPETEAQPIDPRSNRALYFTAGPQASPQQPGIPQNPGVPPQVREGPRGIALQMTECQVVQLAGYTDRVEVSADQAGRRSVTLSYMGGPHPGIYHFTDGRLASMERVEVPDAPKPKKPQPARKKTAKAKKQGT